MRLGHLLTLAGFSLYLVTGLLVALPARALLPEVDSQGFEIPLPDYGADLASPHDEVTVRAATISLGGQWRVYRWDRAADTPAWIYGSGCRLAGRDADDAELEAAARAFIDVHPDIFRARNEELVLDGIVRGAGKIGIHFAQTHEGLPVIGGRVRLALDKSGRLAAFGSEFHSPIDLDPAPSLSAAEALENARSSVPFNPAVDRVLGRQELVVVPVPRFGGGATYRLAWRLRVTTQEPRAVWLTHVDAHTGEIFWRENEIEFLYAGTSKGDVEIHTYCSGASANTPFRNMRVTVLGAGSAIADSTGQFEVAGSAGTLTVHAEFDGTEANVENRDGPDAFVTGSIEENVPLDIVWTDDNSHPAERDAFYFTNETHAYMQDIDPLWDYSKYIVNVNIDETCNAFWTGSSINFCKEGGGCANAARIGDVVAHEYGHGVQSSLLSGQGAHGLGEGNSDILSTLMSNESLIGRGIYVNMCDSGIRDCQNTLRYPEDVIGVEIHLAGRVICGFNWDIWQALAVSLGPDAGKAKAAELWHFSRKIYRPLVQPDQVLAYFLVDDDDENLLNGTPNFDAICFGAGNHGFSCPETLPVYVTHTPVEDTQDEANPYPVVAEIFAYEGSLDPDSLIVNYRISLGPMQSVRMTATGNPDEFAASIPAQPLGTLVQYYILAANDLGGRLTHPENAPGLMHAFHVGMLNVIVDADMEADPGWTEGPSSATRGLWERGDPVGIIKFVQGQPLQLQPEDDHTPNPGAQCWITGNGPGFPGDNSVNNGGETALQTPVYDLDGERYVRVSFWLWYSNDLGTNTDDVFDVDVSTDGGSSWVEIVRRSQCSEENWQWTRIELLDHVSATSNMKFRFVARDLGDASLVEAGVDDFVIQVLPNAQSVDSPAASAPLRFAVEQNRPNPFNLSTEIGYTVPSLSRVTVCIYDLDGRLVRTLVDAVNDPGASIVRWDGRDTNGMPVSSGVYFYRVSGGGFEATRGMTLVR